MQACVKFEALRYDHGDCGGKIKNAEAKKLNFIISMDTFFDTIAHHGEVMKYLRAFIL